MRKISAFTLMEIIIVMIISMIVISLTYKTLDIVTMQFRQFGKSRKHIYELSLVETLLTKDFANSACILRAEEGILCKYSDKDIFYIFGDDYMVRREGSIVDTFNIKPRLVKYYFYEQEVRDLNSYIDKVTFIHEQENTKFFTYRKVYAADFFLNKEVTRYKK